MSKLFVSVEDVVTEGGLVLPPPPVDAPPDVVDTNTTGTGTAVSSPDIVDLDFSQTDKSLEQRFAREEWEYQQQQQQQRQQQQHEQEREREQRSPRGRSRERSDDVGPPSASRPSPRDEPKALRMPRSTSPNVFDRMCIRIAAHTIQARKTVEPALGLHNDNVAQCTFTPVINPISSKMIERRNAREQTRRQNMSLRARSESPRTDKFSTSRRRGSFFGLYEPPSVASPGYSADTETETGAGAGAGAVSPNIRRAMELLRTSPARDGIVTEKEINKQSAPSLGIIFTSPSKASAVGVKEKARKHILHIGRVRSSSESPARPVFGVRSVNLNYILPTDTIGQSMKWAMKQEIHKQREIERRRSPSPLNRYASPVHNAILQEHKKAERRKSHWRNATDFMKDVKDGQSISVTERLNRFYAAREQEKARQSSSQHARWGTVMTPTNRGADSLQFGASEEKSSSSPAPFERVKFSHEHQYRKPSLRFSEAQGKENDIDSVVEALEMKKRRESKIWNDRIFEKSVQKDKNFMERTNESVEEFNVRRGVSDLLILKGVAPSPCTYVVPTSTVERFSASNYRKNLEMKNDNASEGLGNAENGRAGYTFAKEQRQFAQFGHVKIQGLAHKLLDKVFDVIKPAAIVTEKPQSPAPVAVDVADGEATRSISPKPSRRQSVARFDRWGNMM